MPVPPELQPLQGFFLIVTFILGRSEEQHV